MRRSEIVLTAVAAGILAATAVFVVATVPDVAAAAYWLLVVAVLGWGVLGNVAGRGRYARMPVPAGRVLAVVPAYNERLDGLHETVRALLAQTVPCDVVIVDDGSVRPVVAMDDPRVQWIRQGNGGKRAAQVTAFRLCRQNRGRYRYVFTVDSDSVPAPSALEHLLRPMSDPRVWASTGWVLTRNYRDSWVARCADLDVGTALVMSRGSRSMLGAVETVSGALALWRAELFTDHADEYLSDTPAAGDDHWMTARALQRGLVVGVPDAVVATDMPATVRRTFDQRVRWARSTWLMACWSIRRYRWPQLLPLLTTVAFMIAAPVSALAAVAALGWLGWSGRALPVGAENLTAAAVLLGALSALRVLLVGLYLVRRADMPTGQKLRSVAAGIVLLPLFGLFAVTVPTYWSLCRVRDEQWATRDAPARPAGVGSTQVTDPGLAGALARGETVLLTGEQVARELAAARRRDRSRELATVP